jgi:hypothetical protein
MTAVMRKSTIKTINTIRAISIDMAATPVSPKRPAIKAMIKKLIAQFNMKILLVELQVTNDHQAYRFPAGTKDRFHRLEKHGNARKYETAG